MHWGPIIFLNYFVNLLVGRLRLTVGVVVLAVAFTVVAADTVAKVAVAVPGAFRLGQNLGQKVSTS